MTSIIADVHEPSIIVKGLGCPVVALPHGDYQFYGYGGVCVLIERKTISDLLNSLREKRVQRQLREMLNQKNTEAILLIEGDWRVDNNFKVKLGKRVTGWELASVTGFLQTIQDEGVKIVFSPNQDTTTYLIESLYKYYQKKGHKSLAVREKPIYDVDDLTSQRVFMLLGLPGIGEIRATRILDKYKPIEVLLEPDLLRNVDGIGQKTVDRIVEVLGLNE